jgi:hypothetical protein
MKVRNYEGSQLHFLSFSLSALPQPSADMQLQSNIFFKSLTLWTGKKNCNFRISGMQLRSNISFKSH